MKTPHKLQKGRIAYTSHVPDPGVRPTDEDVLNLLIVNKEGNKGGERSGSKSANETIGHAIAKPLLTLRATPKRVLISPKS